MLTKQSISLLTLSALLVLSAGIASANQPMHLETDNVKLTIDHEGGIQVQTPQTTTVVPNRTPASVRVLPNGTRVLRYPVNSNYCREYGTRHSSTVRSGATVNQTHSATSTTTCQ